MARIRAAAKLGELVSVPLYEPPIGTVRALPILPRSVSIANQKARIPSRVFEVLDDLGPSVVVLQSWVRQSAIAALAWAVRNRVPVVMMGDFQVIDRTRSTLKDLIKRRLFRLCDAFVVAGSGHKNFVAKLGVPTSRIWTGFDVVDNEYFARGADEARKNPSNVRRRYGLPERYFLAVSRLERVKNINFLLRAFSRYLRVCRVDPWNLVIAGTGSLRKALFEDSQSLRIAERVRFLGYQDYRAMPHLYGLASAFVHSATREPWGLVVNEAMASSLPVFVSRTVSCSGDLVYPDNGATFDPHKVDELASLLTRATDGTYDLRTMGERSRARISEWSLQTFATNLWEAVQAAAQKQPRTAAFADRVLLSWLHTHPPDGA